MSRLTYLGENGIRTHTAVTATTLGVQVDVPGERVMAIEFYNNGSATVFVHHASSGGATSGRPIPSGSSWTDASSIGPWYLFADSGTVNVRVTTVLKR